MRWRDVDRAAKRGENGQRFAELGRLFAGLQLDEETQANAGCRCQFILAQPLEFARGA